MNLWYALLDALPFEWAALRFMKNALLAVLLLAPLLGLLSTNVVTGLEPLADDDVGDDLRVAGHVEDGAIQLQLPAQLKGVDQVAVVGQGHMALDVVDDDGLGVQRAAEAGGAVAHMANGHGAGAQLLENAGREYRADEALLLVEAENAVVVDHDAAALLAAVLEGIKAVVDVHGDGARLSLPDAEHAAFFMQSAHALASPKTRCIISL